MKQLIFRFEVAFKALFDEETYDASSNEQFFLIKDGLIFKVEKIIEMKVLDETITELEFNQAVESVELNGSWLANDRVASMRTNLCKEVTKVLSSFVELPIRKESVLHLKQKR